MTFAFVRNNSGTRELAGGESGIIYPTLDRVKRQTYELNSKQLFDQRFVKQLSVNRGLIEDCIVGWEWEC